MDSEVMFWLIFFCVGIPLIVFVVCILLNPDFWQGFRNTKFLDELYEEREENSKDIIKR